MYRLWGLNLQPVKATAYFSVVYSQRFNPFNTSPHHDLHTTNPERHIVPSLANIQIKTRIPFMGTMKVG